MRCLKVLSGRVRRIAAFHDGAQLNVVVDAETHCYAAREELCQAITDACAVWAGLDVEEAPLVSSELANLDRWLKRAKTRFRAVYDGRLYIAELFTKDELVASVAINRLDIAVDAINRLAGHLASKPNRAILSVR